MKAHARRQRFWRLALVAVGLYLGAMFLVGLNYAVRSCVGRYATLHCGVENTIAWGEHSLFGLALLIYLVVVFGAWIRR